MTVGETEGEEDKEQDQTPQGKIEKEAPSPGDISGEGATDQRADH